MKEAMVSKAIASDAAEPLAIPFAGYGENKIDQPRATC